MSETYRAGGVAHEIVNASHHVPGGRFLWIDVRCGASLPPQLGPANIGENEPVTCLMCLGHVELEKEESDDDEDDGDGWSCGGGGGLGG